MTKRQKEKLVKIIIASLLFVVAIFLPDWGIWKDLCFLVPYLIAGHNVLWNAARNIFQGRVFDENFLMALATIGAILIGEYPEAVFVMVFFETGELFQNIAVGKSRKSITKLMELAPGEATVLRNGQWETVFPEEILKGDLLLVKPGEKIAVDSVVIKGESDIDTSFMTGESLPLIVKEGDKLISGCVNMSAPVQIRAECDYESSTVSKILELVEYSSVNKGKYENFITRFARVYTPVVVITAFLLAFVPPIFFGNLTSWVMRALAFLVVSCPCALVISVPLAFFGGIGNLSKRGVLVKGSSYIELLSKAEVVITDKTGTITEGNLVVEKIEGEPLCLKKAQSLERFSLHPVARAICRDATDFFEAEDITEIPGKGIKGKIMEKTLMVGRFSQKEEDRASVYVFEDDKCIGKIYLGDKIKENAKESFEKLKALGIEKTVVLTGDNRAGAEKIIREEISDYVYFSLLPADKVSKIEEIIKNAKGKVIYLGDGINDAPCLKRADVGIAMGAIGSDAAIEAADVVFVNDDLSLLPESIKTAKRTMGIVKQNISFSIAVKVFVLILSAFGLAGMWQAVFADVGVMVLAVLNSVRILNYNKMQ